MVNQRFILCRAEVIFCATEGAVLRLRADWEVMTFHMIQKLQRLQSWALTQYPLNHRILKSSCKLSFRAPTRREEANLANGHISLVVPAHQVTDRLLKWHDEAKLAGRYSRADALLELAWCSYMPGDVCLSLPSCARDDSPAVMETQH